MTDRGEIRATSDHMLGMIDRLRAIEEEKRNVEVGSGKFVELAREAETLGRLVFRWSAIQMQLAEQSTSHVEHGRLPPEPLTSFEPRPLDRILAAWREAQLRLEIARPGSEEAAAAADGEPDTSWTTSTYQASLQALDKPGVGLVFDLGPGAEVSRVRVSGCENCSLEIRAADTTSRDDPGGFHIVDKAAPFQGRPFRFDATEGQYWLLFITSLPGGGGGSASVSEVTFRGPR
jgi:hypothetical protein